MMLTRRNARFGTPTPPTLARRSLVLFAAAAVRTVEAKLFRGDNGESTTIGLTRRGDEGRPCVLLRLPSGERERRDLSLSLARPAMLWPCPRSCLAFRVEV